jgi:hypothetical protein
MPAKKSTKSKRKSAVKVRDLKPSKNAKGGGAGGRRTFGGARNRHLY